MTDITKAVLNVGGNNKEIPIPEHYNGWRHDLLDIDPSGRPDIVCDARAMTALGCNLYDAVYCSHNLEHYYPHDVPRVLRGFVHVLKEDGFVEIFVPDIESVMKTVIDRRMDVNDVLYESHGGPITAHDVIYGWGKEIERSGQDFFAHKTGFTHKSLRSVLVSAGLPFVAMRKGPFEIHALAFKLMPDLERRTQLGLPLG